MTFSASRDRIGHLVCHLTDERSTETVTASNPEAAAHLLAALDDAIRDGCGECYWAEGGGEYRWMFRREASTLRIVVLWSTGTFTGWEHVFYAECPVIEFEQRVAVEFAKIEAASLLNA
jgi:hypothetical protein